MKRFFDLFLALAGLVLFAPFASCFAAAVKAQDGGPVFYRQERWGRGGKKFEAYKFRTMLDGADGPEGMRPAEENDSRVTPVGKFLRATAMDELPQLLNILKGEMSFVGPRALAIAEISPSLPGFAERHTIRPGLTGPAQVYARRDAPFEEKLRYDLEYAGNQTLSGDLKLILLSVWITLRGKWESRRKKL